jgi:hypothetical protein
MLDAVAAGLTPLEALSWLLVLVLGVLPACVTIWALGAMLARMAKTNKSGNRRGTDHSTTKPVKKSDGRLKENGGGKKK